MGALSQTDLAVLQDFNDQYDSALAALLGEVDRVALLDFPRYKNAGDSLIWAGQVSALDRLGVDVSYVSDIGRFDQEELDRSAPGAPVLFQGGGNFGDLWPVFQDFRDYVVATNPSRRIITLPQTVRFSSADRAAETDRIFASHGQVTVMVRDPMSLERARRQLPSVEVVLAPDGALANRPFARPVNASSDVLALARTDREKATELQLPDSIDHRTADWHMSPRTKEASWVLSRVPQFVHKRATRNLRRSMESLVQGSYERMLSLNLSSATRILSTGRIVVTDRLHAHVLAILLGIPSVVMENSYGKIKPIFDFSTHKFSTAEFADDTESLVEAVNRRLA